jgi:hypothetical protein
MKLSATGGVQDQCQPEALAAAACGLQLDRSGSGNMYMCRYNLLLLLIKCLSFTPCFHRTKSSASSSLSSFFIAAKQQANKQMAMKVGWQK